MKLSSSVEYATRIMVRLAQAPGDAPLRAESLAETENIPRDYVDQILLRLRRAGLVGSRRGARGGYALARPAAEISIGKVIRAVDKSIFESVCERYSEGDHMCTHTSGCGIRPVWQRLGLMVEEYLEKVTLAQLSGPEPCVGTKVALLFYGKR